MDRRWAWFKRLIKSVDSKFSSVCPAHWRLPLRLCVRFMETTKQHLIHILTELDSKDAIDVSLLLKALQTALRFEQEMESYFEPVFVQAGLKRGRATDFGPATSLTEAVQFASGGDNVSSVSTGTGDDEEEHKFLVKAQTMLKGGVSYGFDRFLGRYVLLEKNNLEEMLKRLSQEEDTAQTAGDGSNSTGSGNVYGSSISMFVFIKNSIKRCTALTTGQAFLSLTKEFKSSMQQYAEMLRTRCPALYSQVTVQSGTVVSATGYVAQPLCRLTPGQESLVCYIINTGEYCSEVCLAIRILYCSLHLLSICINICTLCLCNFVMMWCMQVVPQLEQLIKSKMDEPLRDKVDLTAEIDTFNDLTALGLKAAIGGAMERLDVSFRAMAAKNWAHDAQVRYGTLYRVYTHQKYSFLLQISIFHSSSGGLT